MMQIWDSNNDTAAIEHENVYSHLIPMTTAIGKEYLWWIYLIYGISNEKEYELQKKKNPDLPTEKKKKELKELKVTTDEHFIHTPKKKKKRFLNNKTKWHGHYHTTVV